MIRFTEKKEMKQTNILVLIILCMFSKSMKGQTIITDRPDQTESSSTVPQGTLQLETGVLVEFNPDGASSQSRILAPSTLFRYGLNKAVEFRLLSQFESIKSPQATKSTKGISDLEVGTKIQILRQEGVNTEIALLSHLVIPTGSRGLSRDKYGTINKLSLSHQVSKKASFGYNVGYNYFDFGKGDLTYSAALGVTVNDKVGIYLEPYGELINFDVYEASFDAGFTYLLKDNFQLDFSFGTGINYKMNYFSAGFSWSTGS
jgi:hypothetical protein